MRGKSIRLIGAPVDCGAGQVGASLGPAALRLCGLGSTLRALGHEVADVGDLSIDDEPTGDLPGARNAAQVARWVRVINEASLKAFDEGSMPLCIGGDHSMSIGSVNAAAINAVRTKRELLVLWLDAHADFNTPSTSPSRNIHGMPVAALIGDPELDFVHDGGERSPVLPGNIYLMGLRSVDAEERLRLRRIGVNAIDMRQIDESGAANLVKGVLNTARARNALLHVSLDVDFLDPSIAPGVGTRVAGGATYREAHLIMETLCESGLASSFDIAELNPLMDDRGRTVRLLIELTASLFGRTVLAEAEPLQDQMSTPAAAIDSPAYS